MRAIEERVPGDVSAAAFWLVAGAIHPDAELTLRDVGVNPTRRAVIDILRAMGADIEERPAAGAASADAGRRRAARRPVGPFVRAPGRSTSAPADVAAAIDEIPILCLAATQAARHDRRSAAPASCATRNPTGSPGSRPASPRSARGSTSTATTSRIHGGTPPARRRRPTASTTTAWR